MKYFFLYFLCLTFFFKANSQSKPKNCFVIVLSEEVFYKKKYFSSLKKALQDSSINWEKVNNRLERINEIKLSEFNKCMVFQFVNDKGGLSETKLYFKNYKSKYLTQKWEVVSLDTGETSFILNGDTLVIKFKMVGPY